MECNVPVYYLVDTRQDRPILYLVEVINRNRMEGGFDAVSSSYLWGPLVIPSIFFFSLVTFIFSSRFVLKRSTATTIHRHCAYPIRWTVERRRALSLASDVAGSPIERVEDVV